MSLNNGKNKKWYDYLWIASSIYLLLGFFNILFAWLGLICFFAPLLFAVLGGNKRYCNVYCGRGQLFGLLGGRFKLSLNREIPAFLRSKWFRYGFLTFFTLMFFNMLLYCYFVFAGSADLRETVTLLWSIKVPWGWANSTPWVPHWVTQFAFGFYSVMVTSTILGLITMVLYKPRSWCVYCPMGTMTQLVCKVRNGSFSSDNPK